MFPLQYAKRKPGIKPSMPLAMPITGLYAPSGNKIPQMRSPIKPTANPPIGPHKTPAMNPISGTKAQKVAPRKRYGKGVKHHRQRGKDRDIAQADGKAHRTQFFLWKNQTERKENGQNDQRAKQQQNV